jgi:hypothetical protein
MLCTSTLNVLYVNCCCHSDTRLYQQNSGKQYLEPNLKRYYRTIVWRVTFTYGENWVSKLFHLALTYKSSRLHISEIQFGSFMVVSEFRLSHLGQVRSYGCKPVACEGLSASICTGSWMMPTGRQIVTSQIRDVPVVPGQRTTVELGQFSFSAGCSINGVSGNEERFVFVLLVRTFCLRFFSIHSQCALPQVRRGSEKDGIGTLFYLTTAVNQFPSVRLTYKTMTCNEQCAC